MRQRDVPLATNLSAGLRDFNAHRRPLPGLFPQAQLTALVEQLVESVRRVKYVSAIREQDLSSLRADPNSELFDPLRAAVIHQRQGNLEEAFWLVFLFVHFGKDYRTGWRLIRDIYGALGHRARWDWARTSADPDRFRNWLAANQVTLQGRDDVVRRFGNHRKYESLDAMSPNGTGAVFESYVEWVGTEGSHQQLVNVARDSCDGDAKRAFDHLYKSMNAVRRFGRTAKFDYLTMLGKLRLADIEPGVAYLKGATGPLKGARLLVGGSTESRLSASELEEVLVALGSELRVGMQVMEDALCNWQKSPGRFTPFRG